MSNTTVRAGHYALLRVKVIHVTADGRHANVDIGVGTLTDPIMVLTKNLLHSEAVRPEVRVRWSGSDAIYRVVAISAEHGQAWVELNGRYQTARVRDLQPVDVL